MTTTIRTSLVAALVLASGCARPTPRAPVLPAIASGAEPTSEPSSEPTSDSTSNSTRVVILSLRDVEPYEHVPPREPGTPPPIEIGAPLYGALAGAAMGIVANTGLTLLTEHRLPDHRQRDRDRQGTAALYGAGIGLVGGTLTLANDIAERRKWRDREKHRAAEHEKLRATQREK